MELEELLKLIDAVSKSELTDFKYEEKGFQIKMGKAIVPGKKTETETLPTEKQTVEIQTSQPEEGRLICSPLVGIFYTAPSEEADDFVAVGDPVKKGQVLAIIEAMKLMNEIESDCDGVVAQVLVKNGEAVEYGQPLFRIR